MMVNDDIGLDRAGERIIPCTGLGIHEGYCAEVTEVNLFEGFYLDPEMLYHRPVLAPADNASVDDNRADFTIVLEDIFQSPGTGNGVRIRVIMSDDQDLPLAFYYLTEFPESIPHS